MESRVGKLIGTGLLVAALEGCGGQNTATNQPVRSEPVHTPDASIVIKTFAPSPSETIVVHPSPSVSPTPEISQAYESKLQKIPLQEMTIKNGKFVEYSNVSSAQFATIIAVEPDNQNNILWVAATLAGNKETLVNKEDKNKQNYTQVEGITIWFALDNKTLIGGPNGFVKNNGVDSILPLFKVGSLIDQIGAQPNQGTLAQPDLNSNTLNAINKSVGNANVRSSKKFELYSYQVLL